MPNLPFAAARLSPLAALLLAAFQGAPAQAVPFERLVSPRPAHWVLDTTGTLSAAEIASLDARAEAGRARTGGEIAVAVVDSTDGRPAHEYATALANRWLIGDQAQRNGILILLAKNDRRAEIALGKGIDGEREAALARDILGREMAPRFRDGDWAGGLLAGVEGAAERILDPREAAPAPLPPPAPPASASAGTIRVAWGVGTLVALGVASILFALHRKGRRYRRAETKSGRKP